MGVPTGDLTGSVTEDDTDPVLTVTGNANLSFINDANSWTAEVIAGAFGSQLSIAANGNWTYTANNNDTAIQALDAGETLTETFTVGYNDFFGDPNTTDITITINGVPCFTPGTAITTPHGSRKIEQLQVGDLVVTRDNGLQAIRWIGRRKISGARLLAFPHMRPIRLPANTFAPGWPDIDTDVSPLHRVLVRSTQARLWLNQDEVLVPAKMLIGHMGIEEAPNLSSFDYIHMLFDDHQVIYANNLPTESFHPGHIGLDNFEEEAREELFTLFPSLRSMPETYGKSARYSVKQFEAQLLFGQTPEISGQ